MIFGTSELETYNADGFGTMLWISAFSILNSLLGDQPSRKDTSETRITLSLHPEHGRPRISRAGMPLNDFDNRTALDDAASGTKPFWSDPRYGPEHSATDNPSRQPASSIQLLRFRPHYRSPNGPTLSKGLSARLPISYTGRIDEQSVMRSP